MPTFLSATNESFELAEGTSLWKDAWRRLLKNKLAVVGGILLVVMIGMVLIGPEFLPYTYDQQDFNALNQPPSLAHWFGTDELGRDILVRCLAGGQISLKVALVSTFVSIVIGVSYGAVSGYIGGQTDEVMMRAVDVLYALPFIFIVIVLLSFFERSLMLLYIALGAISWLTMARIVRGQVLSLKNQEFVEAAVSIGVSRPGIIFRHLVPNTLGPVIVYSTLTIPTVMLEESFLSFLGMGVQAPLASWGTMVSSGVQSISIYPWQLIFPAVLMTLTLLSLNFVGDGLRDALDPQMRKN
ncbi:MAG: ABC transporter permease [Acidobacteria bacterium]|nr:ABC transporter permease [Acidobacteriota bacterium]